MKAAGCPAELEFHNGERPGWIISSCGRALQVALVTEFLCDSISESMRRLSAHVALLVIWVGMLSPFVTASQVSTVRACCLRNGMHHCQKASGSSSVAGFQALQSQCPYGTPVLLAPVAGLESAKFTLSTPARSGLVTLAPLHLISASDLYDQSARGPPVSLL